MFSPETIAAVKRTWLVAERDYAVFARRFFERLDETAPHLTQLFATGEADRRVQFRAMASLVVSVLDVVDHVEDGIRTLGARHAQYDIGPDDFALFSEALVTAVEEQVGDIAPAEAMSETERDAWRTVLGRVSVTMLEARAASVAARPT